MTEDPHATLVDRASRGEGEALDALVARHFPKLIAYVRLHAGPHLLVKESVSDLAQSVCREVLDDLDDFEYRGEPAFRKWLFTAALNKLRERHRYWQAERRDVRREQAASPSADAIELMALAPSDGAPSRAAMAEEDLARLEQAFEQLSDDDRTVLTLARIVGLPHKQIAEEMGRSEGATRVLLHRAQYRLGVILTELRSGR